MNEPRRLRDEASSELLRAMIDAAREEEPSEAAIEQALSAIGSAPLGADALTGAAEAQALAQKAAQLGAAGHGATAGLLLKWAGIGLAAGLGAAQLTEGLPFIDREPPAVVEAPTPLRAEPRPEANEPPPALELKAPPAKEAPRAVEAVRKAKQAPKSAAGRLAHEVAALDRARKALAKRDPRRTLVALDRYEREHRRGELLPEALLLRAEALAEMGDREAAARVARRLVGLQPNGPHAARAQALIRGVPR